MNGIQAAATGRIGTEADKRYSRDGKPVLSFSLAVTERVRDEETTVWLRCAVFGELAETLSERLAKGQECYVEGAIHLDTWEKDGQQRSGLSLRCWVCQPLGAFRRPRPEREDSERMPQGQAIPRRDTRALLDLD